MSNVGIQTHAERQYQRILEDGNLSVNVGDICAHDYQHETTMGVEIIACINCGDIL
jgi:hypothetical protein